MPQQVFTTPPQAIGTAPIAPAAIQAPIPVKVGEPVSNNSQAIASPSTNPVSAIGRDLRAVRNYGIAGGLFVFLISVGLGFLARTMHWTSDTSAYDEFVIDSLIIGVRDATFGVFIGISLSEIRRSAPRWTLANYRCVRPLLAYGSIGAAVFLAPFILLRTSLILLPIGLSAAGFVLGMLVCGVRFAGAK